MKNQTENKTKKQKQKQKLSKVASLAACAVEQPVAVSVSHATKVARQVVTYGPDIIIILIRSNIVLSTTAPTIYG